MPLNDITFEVKKGGLERTLPNQDHVSGLLFPSGSAPASFVSATGKEFRSIEQVEAAGIEKTGTYQLEHYHASEFFRASPSASLWIFFGTADPDIIVNLTKGTVRQFGVVSDDISSDLVTYQSLMSDLASRKAPAVIVLGATKESLFSDLNALNYPQCAVLVSGSNSGQGKVLADALTLNSVSSVGLCLGALSFSNVHENISWVSKFRLDGNGELTDNVTTGESGVTLSDGETLADLTVADLKLLDEKRYIFIRRHVGRSGVYFNDSYTAVDETDDFSNLENNRTIQKAIRDIRTVLLPELGSPVYVDASTGKLSAESIGFFESMASRPLADMERNGELSEGGFEVYIDPDQNILSTSILQVVVRLVPVGVARQIEVTIGLTTQI